MYRAVAQHIHTLCDGCDRAVAWCDSAVASSHLANTALSLRQSLPAFDIRTHALSKGGMRVCWCVLVCCHAAILGVRVNASGQIHKVLTAMTKSNALAVASGHADPKCLASYHIRHQVKVPASSLSPSLPASLPGPSCFSPALASPRADAHAHPEDLAGKEAAGTWPT